MKGSHRTRRLRAIAAAGMLGFAAVPAHAQSIEDLRDLSLDELANVNISSVSKTSEALADAPAAVFVITHDDIVRSGATTIPEILRLAPNLYVAQMTGSNYTITARGLSGNQRDQNFTNKLLVMIDGRSVYTPLYSGVYWDMQDVLPDDIERIEIVSGPGATLWGANAVNGVINIITRRSGETQGLLLSADGGAFERTGGVRYGGKLSENLAARFYVSALDQDQTRTSKHPASDSNILPDVPAGDAWWRIQGGFRLDWAPNDGNDFTAQGDLMRSIANAYAGGDEVTHSRNLLARWTRHETDGGAFEVQAYYDDEGRRTRDNGGAFSIATYDLYIQHNNTPTAKDDFVWGGGIRASRFDIHGNASIYFTPPQRTLVLANAFAQYGWAFTPRAKLTIGFKVEKDPYAGAAALPSARLSWKPTEPVLLWAAVSRAVRSPTPFDRDVVEAVGGSPFVIGNRSFRTEKLTAFEAGTRIRPSSRASLSVSAYYNLYDDLKAIEVTPISFLPLYWSNAIKGHTYGLEAWADLSLTRWWKLSGGLNLLHKDLRFRAGATGILGVAQAGDDPRHQETLNSTFTIGRALSIEANFRHVGRLPEPFVPAYSEVGGRISWRLNDRMQFSLSGLNLLHKWHQELPEESANQIPRSIRVGLKWHL